MQSKGRPKGSKNTVFHKYTKEEKEYLNKIIPGNSHKEIQSMFKSKFKIELTLSQIEGFIKRSKVKTGRTGCFKKGHIPFNKGMKLEDFLSEEDIEKFKTTQFKKGHCPINHRKIGDERVTKDGYIEIKIKEPNVWVLKQRYLYEKYNNIKIKKVDYVLFADRNKRNFSKENLILVTRSQLLKLNQYGYIKENADLTKTGLNIVKLLEKIKDVENGKTKRK